jgi:hypothetical protein
VGAGLRAGVPPDVGRAVTGIEGVGETGCVVINPALIPTVR